jgi:hypothetical protein
MSRKVSSGELVELAPRRRNLKILLLGPKK